MNPVRVGPFLAALVGVGCRCSEESHPAEPEQERVQIRRCTKVESSSTLRIPALGPPADQSQQGVEFPFSVEVGRLLLTEEGFLLPFSRGDGGAVRVGVASFPAGGIVDLGPVHGDWGPPTLDSGGGRTFIVLGESDASGGSYRVGELTKQSAGVRWLAELDAGNDDSPGYALSASHTGNLLLVAQDEWDADRNESYIQLSRIRVDAGEPLRTSSRLSPVGRDVEQPTLVRRPGGFWLAWVVIGTEGTYGGDVGPAPVDEDDGTERVIVQSRHLELLQLDEDGAIVGKPLPLPSEHGSIHGVDFSSGHDGSLLVAWRAYEGPPGVEGGVLGLSRVTADGTLSSEVLQAEQLGTFAPALLYDRDPGGGAPHGWLVAASAVGTTKFAALGPHGQLLETLEEDPLVGASALLAADHGTLITAAARGRDIEVGLLKCLDAWVQGPSSQEPAEALDEEPD